MLADFNRFVTEHQLFDKSHRLLLAVSGGMDSITLADLLHKGGYTFAIAHCNFCLRGEESDGDEEFVQKLAKKYKAPFFVEKFDTKAFAEQEKISTQMAARALRYAWFDKILKGQGYDYLLTAHHQNDLLETVLLNFVRGTGISGFHGIRPKNGTTVRPLLFADREQVRDYVAAKFLAWREDSSNESNKYYRNLVRNEVVPLLKKINPNLEDTAAQTVEKVSVAEEVFFESVEKWRETAVQNLPDGLFIDIEKVLQKPVLFLYELLRPFNFNYDDAVQIYQSAGGAQPGKQFVSLTYMLVRDRQHLVLTPKDLSVFGSLEIAEGATFFDFAGQGFKISIADKNNVKIDSSPKVALLDYEKLKFPLKVRKWKEGDWFIPLGMNGKKKVSDFLVDKKVPLNLKEKVMVITSGDSILWIAGWRIDDRFKVREATQKVYRIEMKG